MPAPAPAPACGQLGRALPLRGLTLALGRLQLGLIGPAVGQRLLPSGVAVCAARQQLLPVAQPQHGVGDKRRVFGWRAADRADVFELGPPLELIPPVLKKSRSTRSEHDLASLTKKVSLSLTSS